MTKASLYAERHCQIPVFDKDEGQWHVRYYSDYLWHQASFDEFKEASYFYNTMYKQLLEYYKQKHSGDIVDPKQLSLKFTDHSK